GLPSGAQAPAPLVAPGPPGRVRERHPATQTRCSWLNAQPVGDETTTPALLRSLLLARGPSGQEEEAAKVWREAAAIFADVSADTLGSSFARVSARGGAGAPTLALMGHIDEIGLSVTHIDDKGLLAFTTVGGISPEVISGQRVELLTDDGVVNAI